MDTILLAGLPNQYQPMIMAIESSGMRIIGDAIKTKLLQEEKANVLKLKNTETDSAYYCKQQRLSQKQQAKAKGPKCFSCNSYGHIAKECPKRKENPQGTQKAQQKRSEHKAFITNLSKSREWYIDWGLSTYVKRQKHIF